jgi:hypothetical protein
MRSTTSVTSVGTVEAAESNWGSDWVDDGV